MEEVEGRREAREHQGRYEYYGYTFLAGDREDEIENIKWVTDQENIKGRKYTRKP